MSQTPPVTIADPHDPVARVDLPVALDEPVGRIGILRPLKIRDFRLMWTGLTVSLLGDGIYFVAIAWQVYELSNAPTALSLVSVAWSLPLLLFVLIGGLASDRFDRRRVLMTSDLIRGTAITIMGILSITGVIRLWHVVALVAVFGTGEAFFGPALGSIVPDLVPKNLLVEANSLDNFVRPLAERLIGPAIGGLMVAAVGPGRAFVLDGLTFAISAIAVGMMRPHPRKVSDASIDAGIREIKEGFRFVRSQPWLWGTLLSASLTLLFALGPFQVLLPYLVKNKLGGGADTVGLVLAAGGVGAIISAVVLGQRGLPRRHITFMYFGWGVGVLLLVPYAFVTQPWQAMVVEMLAWGSFTAGMIVWMTLMHRLVPTDLLGRVTSLDWLVSAGLIPLSFALTGPVSSWLGVETTFVVCGILAAISTFGFLLFPGVRDTEKNGALKA